MIRTGVFFILIFALNFGTAFAAPNHSFSKSDALAILADWEKEVRQNPTENDHQSLREKDLELEFVNRLIFQVERNYQGNNAKKFFTEIIWDMYLTDSKAENRSFGSSEVFLSTLHQALEEVLEPQENPLHFVKNFTRFTSIQDPVTIDAFAATRNYFNGKTALQADPMSINQAAEIAEDRLKKQAAIKEYNLLEEYQDLRSEFPKF